MKDTKKKKGLASPDLPKEVIVSICDLFTDDEIGQRINDYLAEKYGFCNNGFTYSELLTISDIDWDTGD